MVVMFQDGGPFMYLILGTFLLLVTVAFFVTLLAIAARLKTILIWPARISAVLGLLANVGTLIVGSAGYMLGAAKVQEAIVHAAPEDKERLMQMGMEVASYPLTFGTTLMFLGGAVWLVPFVIAMIPVSKNYDDLLDDEPA